MQLFFHNKVGEVPIFDNIKKLMDASYGSDALSLKEAADLMAVKAIQDPVRDFVDFYFREQGIPVSDIDKMYIINRLYEAKGGLKVFDVMKELLSVPEGASGMPIDFTITCEYDFPDMNLLNFNELKVSDINMFINKLFAMMYVLLFYDKIRVTIGHYIIRVVGEMNSYICSGAVPYTITTPQRYSPSSQTNGSQGN